MLKFSVDIKLLVNITDFITGQTDYALNKVNVFIQRVFKDNNVTALGRRAFSNRKIENRETQTVLVLVNENKVTGVQSRQHRSGRNTEGLGKERAQKENKQNDREKTARVFNPFGLSAEFLINALSFSDNAHLALINGLAIQFRETISLFLGTKQTFRAPQETVQTPNNAGAHRQ